MNARRMNFSPFWINTLLLINRMEKLLFSNFKYNSYNKGNTLAEMLITLVVIGVVFTISMGIFVADHNKNQTVVRLEKSFSTFSRAFIQSAAQNGSPETWVVSNQLSEKSSYQFFERYLKPFLILSKDCKNSTEGSCDFVFKELNGTEKSLNSTWARFYLNDGTFVGLQARGGDKYRVVYLYVDTNGKKRLNVVARDIFMLEYWLQNDDYPEYVGKLYPYGHEYSKFQLTSTDNENNCNPTKNGNYCAALIIKDNWQIVEGYPWAQARYVVQ